MKKALKKKIGAAGAVLIAAALIIYLALPLSVPGLVLEAGDYQNAVKEQGELTAERYWNIYAPEALVVQEILVEEGQRVLEGEFLLQFDDSLVSRQRQANQNSLQIQLDSLSGELASLRAQKDQYSPTMVSQTQRALNSQKEDLRSQIANAQTVFDSQTILYAEGAVSRTQLDQARLNLNALEASLQELEASSALQIKQMNANYQHYAALENSLAKQIATLTELLPQGDGDWQSAQLNYVAEQALLTAPAAGTVLRIAPARGERANTGEPVITIYDQAYIGAEVYVQAADASLLYPGMKANVTVNGANGARQNYGAVVRSVAPYAQEILSGLGLNESKVKVTLSLTDGESAIVGQTVDVEFILESLQQGLAIPKTAVFDYEDGYAVLRAVKGKAQIAPIEKAFETDTLVVIASGLAEGDTVILTPTASGLKTGKRVSIK